MNHAHQRAFATSADSSFHFYFFKDFIYLFLERGQGREKEERNIDQLPACALTGTQTGDFFALWDDAQPTEPHQPGRVQTLYFFN